MSRTLKEIKVLLVVPSLDIKRYKGLARFSYELVRGLEKRVDLEVYEVYKKRKDYLTKNLTLTPLKELISKVDIIHSVIPESATFLFLIKKFKNVRTVVTFHDLIPILYGREFKFRFQSLIKLYLLFMWKNGSKTDVVVANSTQTAKEVEKFFRRKVDQVINPGVDEKFKPIPISKEKPTLGFFANFSYRKGLDKAIEVFKLVKKEVDCRLIIAGGYLKTIYQKQFNPYKLTKGLKDVEIFGYVPEEKIVEIYNSFDVYLFPSVYEGFGLPILEAQRCGVPVVTFSWARIPEETKKMTIQSENVEEMAENVIRLLTDSNYYKKISIAGIKYARKFTWENLANSYLEIYKKLIENKK